MNALNVARDCWPLTQTNWCPVSSEKTRPGAGATAAFLEASTGRRAYYLGKPNGYMFHSRQTQAVAELALGKPDEVVMIGDTMETDIRGAFEAGMASYLVLSGSTKFEDLGDYVYQPMRVLQSVAELVEEIQTGKSPGLTHITPGAARVPTLNPVFGIKRIFLPVSQAASTSSHD